MLIPFKWVAAKFSQSRSFETSGIDDVISIADIPRPKFDELPLKQGDPKGSAWGLWGTEDERGTLNLITEDITRAASRETINGKVVSLK